MIKAFLRRKSRQATIDAVYGMIVAQARSPIFYSAFGVADTVNGRFEMIILHLWLVLERLKSEPGATASWLGQGVFDRFCDDMDGHLREMGTGDLTVPKEMHKVGEAFYGRAKAYDLASGLAHGSTYDVATTESSDEPLTQALARNVFDGKLETGARRLAIYIRMSKRDLAAQSGESFARGELKFPHPE